MSIIDAKRVAEVATEVSNEFVLGGKNPGVLLIDVCVEVARRLFGVGEGDSAPGVTMTRAEVERRTAQAVQVLQNLGTLVAQGQQLAVSPHVRDGREIVMLGLSITGTRQTPTGPQYDYLAHCEVLDQFDKIGFQKRYRSFTPLA